VVSLGDEDETVARGKFGKGFVYVRKELDLLIGDGLSETDDALVFVRRDGTISKLLKTGDERLTKAGQAVAARGDGGPLDAVEALANLLGGVDAMVEIRDERGDGSLKVNVVLPKRVVCVNEQGLIRRVAYELGFAVHWG